jgi:3-(3-hydroxy-phenyl)propionate hydroxylase
MSYPIELNEKSENCYTLNSKYAIACDGSRSSIRQIMGLESTGRVFQDRFLIADVKMKAEFPTERWFWFDPPFHPNQSVLLHRQPDNVWRIDFQLGWDADPEVEKRPENIMPRVKALLAHGVKAGEAMPEFELEWASVYTFACQRMEKFVHDRVIFAGDSAHGVSPFGARGANSGIQDADNLGWKLDAVLRGLANKALLQTYGAEREFAADENIKNSTRATDFITPKSTISRIFRDAVLDLAAKHPFARTLVNSGRLSVPATLYTSELSTTDVDVFNASVVLGSPALDAPVRLPDGQVSWLLKTLSAGFTLIVFDAELDTKEASYPCTVIHVQSVWFDSNKKLDNTVIDSEGLIQKRYDMQAGTAYLLRPDQHVCARWRQPTQELVLKAIQRCYSPQVQI